MSANPGLRDDPFVRRAGLAALLIGFGVSFLTYRGPFTGYWDTYIAVPAALLTGDAVEYVDEAGTPLYRARAPERLPRDLVQPDTFGLATNDQGLGGGVHYSLPFLALGRAGLRFGHALGLTLTAGLIWLAARRLLLEMRRGAGGSSSLGAGEEWVALAAGLLVAWNPMTLALATLNAGLPSMLLIALLFLLFLHPDRPWFVAGIAFGVLGGIRDMSILFIPAVAFWLLSDERRWRAWTLFGAGALLGILPILVWKDFAFGSPLADPTQFADHRGFRPFFPHRILGHEFLFNGLLNFPFHEQWVRTPHFPFPTVVTLPLVFVRCFGTVLCAAALVGAGRLLRLRPRIGTFTALWFVLFFLFLAPQENWEELKGSTIVLMFVPWGLWIACGLQGLIEPRSRGRGAPPRAAGGGGGAGRAARPPPPPGPRGAPRGPPRRP